MRGGGFVRMPSIMSRPSPAIESPPMRAGSGRSAEFDSPHIRVRGCTARNTSGKKKKRKIELVNNSYYDAIIKRIDKVEKCERTGKNRLVTIGNLENAASNLVCKECVTEEIDKEREQCVELFSKHLAKKIANFKAKQNIFASSLHC